MTPDEKSKINAEITAKINKITMVTDLCNHDIFDKIVIGNLIITMDNLTEDDRLYILWIWAINDDFAKDSKFPHIVNNYSTLYKKLASIMKENNSFIMQYIKTQSQILRDSTLELMHLHNDYENPDLINSINITTKIIEE